MMYKKIFTICLLIVSYSSISFGQTETKVIEPTPQIVGGDSDAHGCKPSAGYTFSIIKNDCIRVFEQKIQLDEVNPTKSYTSIAALIFSDDKKQVEVFMPSMSGSVVLKKVFKTKFPTWKQGNLMLIKKGNYYLKQANKVIFSGE